MASTYLTITNGSTTNRKTATFSVWVKRTVTGVDQFIFRANTGSNKFRFWFGTDDKLNINNQVGGVNQLQFEPDRRYRDIAAWYHIVIAIDTTQSVEANRFKLYINGTQQTDSSVTGGTYPTLNQDLQFNQNVINYIGWEDPGSYFDGSMSHFNLIDGTQYAASDFGETDSTSGIWKIKISPSVTYGTNGFYLKMEDRTNLDLDSSPNAHTFTTTGTLTATYDNPENNFCTMNSLDNFYANQTFTQGNNTVKSDNPAPATSTMGMSSGKWYLEGNAFFSTTGGGGDWQIGIVGDQTKAISDEIGNYANSWAYYGATGDYRNNNSNASYGDTYGYNIIGVALDLDNNKLYFSKDGVWQNSGVPTSGATGTGALSIAAPASTPLGAYFIGCGANGTTNKYTWALNFGNGYFGTTVITSPQADDAGEGAFKYDVPAGFYAICTNNLATYG